MAEDAGEGAAELLGIGADGVAAAFAMGEGDDAVDVGREGGLIEAGGDEFGGVGGAVGSGDDGDVVAGASATVFALVAHKRGHIGGGGGVGDFARRELVIEVLFFKGDVLGMDVLAGLDGMFRAADDLPVAVDAVAGEDGFEANLVAGGDGILRRQGDSADAEFGAGADGDAEDGDVVGGVELDRGVFRGGEFFDFYKAHRSRTVSVVCSLM